MAPYHFLEQHATGRLHAALATAIAHSPTETDWIWWEYCKTRACEKHLRHASPCAPFSVASDFTMVHAARMRGKFLPSWAHNLHSHMMLWCAAWCVMIASHGGFCVRRILCCSDHRFAHGRRRHRRHVRQHVYDGVLCACEYTKHDTMMVLLASLHHIAFESEHSCEMKVCANCAWCDVFMHHCFYLVVFFFYDMVCLEYAMRWILCIFGWGALSHRSDSMCSHIMGA